MYYFNFATGESLWEHPKDEHYRALFEEEKLKLEARGGESEHPSAISKSTLELSASGPPPGQWARAGAWFGGSTSHRLCCGAPFCDFGQRIEVFRAKCDLEVPKDDKDDPQQRETSSWHARVMGLG